MCVYTCVHLYGRHDSLTGKCLQTERAQFSIVDVGPFYVPNEESHACPVKTAFRSNISVRRENPDVYVPDRPRINRHMRYNMIPRKDARLEYLANRGCAFAIISPTFSRRKRGTRETLLLYAPCIERAESGNGNLAARDAR